MDLKTKRKKTMDMLCSALDKIDPSKENSALYRKKFDKMSDKEFDKYMTEFLSDPENIFYLEILEYERPLKMENIEAMAEHIGIPLYEKVALPYVTMDKSNVVVTPEPVPVGYIHEKLMVQLLLKKNSVSMNVEKRSAKSGQVTADSKTARTSDVESYSMIALQANEGLKELLGPRADDWSSKNQMYNKLTKDGYMALSDLDSSVEDKVALNTLDAYFLLMGIKTNLIAGGDNLPKPKVK